MTFKVGDRVRAISEKDSCFGQEGPVTAVGRVDGTAIYDVDFGGSGYSGKWRFLGEEPLELVTTTTDDSFEQALDTTLAEVRAVMIDRHTKYGPGNINRHGEYGVVVRLGDKYERLDHSRELDFADEAVDDTALDIIGYGLIFAMLRAGRWPGQKPTPS